MRFNIHFKRNAPNNCIKVRNVRSLADAVEMYHRTGVFDMHTSEVGSYDIQDLDAGSSVDRLRELDLQSYVHNGTDLLIAAATQMHDPNKRSQQLTNIKQPSTAAASLG